jgi:polyhydroxybutyrate depolymerase
LPTAAAPPPGSLVSARPYELDVPPGYDPARPAPLLLSLHGYGDSGQDLGAERWPLAAAARAHGIFVAHPDGTMDHSHMRFWDATDSCCNFDGPPVDDVAYLMDVIGDVSARYHIDPKRIWVSGLSNGGFMGHRLACDRAGKIAAVVSVAGATWRDPERCRLGSAVSFLEIHESEDPIVKYEGGFSLLHKDAAEYPSVDATVAQSAAKDGCTGGLAARGTAAGFDGDDPRRVTEMAAWSGCPAGIDVERWKMMGARHIPNVARAWAEAVVAWLERHPKP